MKILFCKISSMKYYKGACDEDIPVNGGSFVAENGFGHEEFNFCPFEMDGSDDLECVGFVEPKSNRGSRNTFHIERIEGCEAYSREPYIDDVLVVWCAKSYKGEVTVVGWYKHATVWRNLLDWTLDFPDHSEERYYNVRAKASECVLLPEGERNRHIWSVPLAKRTGSYGFGQSMVWYPTEPEAEQYLSRLLESMDEYSGDNWLNKYPSCYQVTQ